MRKKIIGILIVGLLVLCSFTAVGVNVSNSHKLDQNHKNNNLAPQLAHVEIMILENAIPTIFARINRFSIPFGDVSAYYNIDLSPLPSSYRVDGSWSVSIYVDDVMFFSETGEFDYTGSNNPAPKRVDNTKYIDEGRHFVSVSGTLLYNFYIGDNFIEIRKWTDDMSGWVTFPKLTSSINNKQVSSNNLLIRLIEHFPFLGKILNQII